MGWKPRGEWGLGVEGEEICLRDASLVEEALRVLEETGIVEDETCIRLREGLEEALAFLEKALTGIAGQGFIRVAESHGSTIPEARRLALDLEGRWMLLLPGEKVAGELFALALKTAPKALRGREAVAPALALAEALGSLGIGAELLWPDTVLVDDRAVFRVVVEAFLRPYSLTTLFYPLILARPPGNLPRRSFTVLAALHALLTTMAVLEDKLEELESRIGRFDLLEGRRVAVEVDEGIVEGVAKGYTGDGRLIVDTGLGLAAIPRGRVVWVERLHRDQQGSRHSSHLDDQQQGCQA